MDFVYLLPNPDVDHVFNPYASLSPGTPEDVQLFAESVWSYIRHELIQTPAREERLKEACCASLRAGRPNFQGVLSHLADDDELAIAFKAAISVE